VQAAEVNRNLPQLLGLPQGRRPMKPLVMCAEFRAMLKVFLAASLTAFPLGSNLLEMEVPAKALSRESVSRRLRQLVNLLHVV
jgi:hypothetical protein